MPSELADVLVEEPDTEDQAENEEDELEDLTDIIFEDEDEASDDE
jgi:hypothetical protein